MHLQKPTSSKPFEQLAAGIPRPKKPRSRGLTVVIDKGLGLSETKDLLEVAAEAVDFVKFGFGTSLLYDFSLLRRKLHRLRDFGVQALPGGTLLEIAYHHGAVAEFFRFARLAGFSCVEVSDGTVELPKDRRRDLIRRGRDYGFTVLSEVGKKDPARPLDPKAALEQIEADLEAGAYKVIVEGRDSGQNIGIFDAKGQVRESLFELLVAGLPRPEDVIWEAPRSDQQQALLVRLGPDVNFGNVQPEDVVTLEAMRRGLRGDTLRLRLLDGPGLWR